MERETLAEGVGRLDLVKGDIGLSFLLKALGARYIKGVTWLGGLIGSGGANPMDFMTYASFKGPVRVIVSRCGLLHLAIVGSSAKPSAVAAGPAGWQASRAGSGLLVMGTNSAPAFSALPKAYKARMHRSMQS